MWKIRNLINSTLTDASRTKVNISSSKLINNSIYVSKNTSYELPLADIFDMSNNAATRNLANIYILELNSGKYYIGRSYIPHNRIRQHREEKIYSAKWVRRWGFKEVIAIFPERNIFEEDYYTKLLMHKYGIEHVRGGTYFSPILLPSQIALLQKEFDSAQHRCFKCGDVFTRHHRCNFATASTFCYYCMTFGHRMTKCPKLNDMKYTN